MTLTIYTIGHSTRSFDEFLGLLGANGIGRLADVRRFPKSRRHPHFNDETLRPALDVHHIEYVHMPELGGRRKPVPDSPNTAWRNESFRAYADHMATAEFQSGLDRLVADGEATAIMCAEAVPWKCHRNLIADELTRRHVDVIHILALDSTQRHRLHPAAVDAGTHLIYPTKGPSKGQKELAFPTRR